MDNEKNIKEYVDKRIKTLYLVLGIEFGICLTAWAWTWAIIAIGTI